MLSVLCFVFSVECLMFSKLIALEELGELASNSKMWGHLEGKVKTDQEQNGGERLACPNPLQSRLTGRAGSRATSPTHMGEKDTSGCHVEHLRVVGHS